MSNDTIERKMAFSAVISGRVQGVGFRHACAYEARRLGLCGWVKNAWDGSVEVWSEGPVSAQECFLGWLREGPPFARVKSIRTAPEIPTGKYQNFSVQY
ncbi:MAG: acylphosphatase [Spirochaetaceae bacterium]|jgi:acylphosphatase|nr:acylphosphatase [Spirochaetaceae bacterium]